MGFKRRKFNPKASSSRGTTSSSRPKSSRPEPFARLSSVSRSIRSTPPAFAQGRVSLKLQASQSSSRSRNEDVIPLIESEEDIQAREDADEMNEIIMAIDMREKGTMGCAYYIAREEKLYLMQDIKMAGLDIVDTLKTHAQPTLILISTRSDEQLEGHLSKEARGLDRGDEASELIHKRITHKFQLSIFR